MILKNRVLSGFEKMKNFGEERVCFIERQGVFDDVENMKNQDVEKTKKLKLKLSKDGEEESFDYFFKRGSKKSYIEREIQEKGDFFKKYIYFATGKNKNPGIEKEKENIEENIEEIEKKIEELKNKKNGDSLNDDLIDKQISAFEGEKKELEFFLNKEKDEIEKDIENDFFKDQYKNFEDNYESVIGNKEKEINEKIHEIESLKKWLNSEIPPNLLGEIKYLETMSGKISENRKKFLGDSGKFNFENFKKEAFDFGFDEKYKKELKKHTKKLTETDSNGENKYSEDEVNNIAFSKVIEDFLKYYFKGLTKSDIDENKLDKGIKKIDKYIEYGKSGADFNKCEELCDLIPGMEGQCSNIFSSSNGVNFDVIDDIIKNYCKDNEEEGMRFILDSIKNNKESDKNNLFLTGELFYKLSDLKNKFYEKIVQIPEIKNFCKNEEIDLDNKNYLNNPEDLKKIKDEFEEKMSNDKKISQNGFNKKFDFDDEILKNADLEGFKTIFENSMNNCKTANNSFIKKENQKFISDKDTEKIFEIGNNTINELNEEFSGKILEIEKIEKEIEESIKNKDKTKEEFLKKHKEFLLNKIKEDYLDHVKGIELSFMGMEDDIGKNKREYNIFMEVEGPQPVTLGSIILMIKEIYNERNGNKKWDIETAEKRSAGVMAKGLGFTDAVNVGNRLIKDAKGRINEYFESNEKNYASYTTSQLKAELDMFANKSGGKFNGTALHGVINTMVDKGIFEKNDKNFLKALHLKEPFLNEKLSLNDALLEFINLDDASKDRILSEKITDLKNGDDEKYFERVEKAKRGFEAGDGKALDLRKSPADDLQFIRFRDEYLKKGEGKFNNNPESKDFGCIKKGDSVDIDNVGKVNKSIYMGWLNNFVDMKLFQEKQGIYGLIEAIATGMVPMDLAMDSIKGSLANTFGWLDSFKKGLVPVDEIREAYATFSKPHMGESGIIRYTYGKGLTSEQKINNRVIEDRVSNFIKGLSDDKHEDTNKEFFSGKGPDKWRMESTAGKLVYDKFESYFIGKGNQIGVQNVETISSFINGIGFEVANYGVKGRDKYGNYLKRPLNQKGGEKERLKQTFKTFLAYRSKYIQKNYKDLDKDGKVPSTTTELSSEILNKKPVKFGGEVKGSRKSLKGQSDSFFDLFKEIESKSKGSMNHLDILEKSGSENSKADDEKIAEYFGRGKGNFKNDVDAVFDGIGENELFEIIQNFRESDNFPHRSVI